MEWQWSNASVDALERRVLRGQGQGPSRLAGNGYNNVQHLRLHLVHFVLNTGCDRVQLTSFLSHFPHVTLTVWVDFVTQMGTATLWPELGVSSV